MRKLFIGLLLLATCGYGYYYSILKHHIIIAEQGSFFAGGKVLTDNRMYNPDNPYQPDGQTYRGDHAYCFYQKPLHARKYPLVFAHGIGQSSKTWETTPDGRDGFQNIFLKNKFSVYLVDQPRRGKAGRSLSSAMITPSHDEQLWFNRFRIGIWPDYFDGVQFPKDEASLNQFLRQQTPTIGKQDLDVYADGYAAVLEKSGPAILVTHFQGGPVGWLTAMKSDNVRAIVSYEPGGSFPFVKEENPTTEKAESGQGETIEVAESEVMKFTRYPIAIYYGDYLGNGEPETPKEQTQWYKRLQIARKWADAINSRGGDVTVIHLPEAGLHGNTHFPMSDLNNAEVAELLLQWLHEKNLD